MIKCPKCGSINIVIERRPDGWCYCGDCSYSWQRGRKEPELTVAEKLLWLAENCRKIEINGRDKAVLVWKDKKSRAFYEENVFMNITLKELITAAYSWAKEQEK